MYMYIPLVVFWGLRVTYSFLCMSVHAAELTDFDFDKTEQYCSKDPKPNIFNTLNVTNRTTFNTKRNISYELLLDCQVNNRFTVCMLYFTQYDPQALLHG